jgi:two-component system, cell cycle response regulator CpdR
MARILVADDEEAIRNLLARALRQDGHEVMTACDGADALGLLVRENGAFELLLTDIRMPVMDGIALALAAARDHPAVTILLMTGYADQRERAHGLDALITTCSPSRSRSPTCAARSTARLWPRRAA